MSLPEALLLAAAEGEHGEHAAEEHDAERGEGEHVEERALLAGVLGVGSLLGAWTGLRGGGGVRAFLAKNGDGSNVLRAPLYRCSRSPHGRDAGCFSMTASRVRRSAAVGAAPGSCAGSAPSWRRLLTLATPGRSARSSPSGTQMSTGGSRR